MKIVKKIFKECFVRFIEIYFLVFLSLAFAASIYTIFYNIVIDQYICEFVKFIFFILDILVKSSIIAGGISIFTGVMTKADTQYYLALYIIFLNYFGSYATKENGSYLVSLVFSTGTFILLIIYFAISMYQVCRHSRYYQKHMQIKQCKIHKEKKADLLKYVKRKINNTNDKLFIYDFADIVIEKYIRIFDSAPFKKQDTDDNFYIYFDNAYKDIVTIMDKTEEKFVLAKYYLKAIHERINDNRLTKNKAFLGFYAASFYAVMEELSADERDQIFLCFNGGDDDLKLQRRYIFITLAEIWYYVMDEKHDKWKREEFNAKCYFNINEVVCGEDAWIENLWNIFKSYLVLKNPFINRKLLNNCFVKFIKHEKSSYYWS